MQTARIKFFTLKTARGLSLVELMVALALGLIISLVVGGIYLSTKGSFARQQQLSILQRKARMAFEALVYDARLIGYYGCFTEKGVIDNQLPDANTTLENNYNTSMEGFDYTLNNTNSFDITETQPTNIDIDGTDKWSLNPSSAGGLDKIDIAKINPSGLTPGSDVMVIRSVTGHPQRLAGDSILNSQDFELAGSPTPRGWCTNKDPALPQKQKLGGFCADSHVLISSCANALVTSVEKITASSGSTKIRTKNPNNALYPAASSELFPLQTVAYYVSLGSTGRWPSLYRRVFDGQEADGIEEELIEGVESMQLTYASDTSTPKDGIIDGEYEVASEVKDWNKVMAVRMSLWLRTPDEVRGNLPLGLSGTANGVTITYPLTRHDRRVFTTTVALRNRIQLAAPSP